MMKINDLLNKTSTIGYYNMKYSEYNPVQVIR